MRVDKLGVFLCALPLAVACTSDLADPSDLDPGSSEESDETTSALENGLDLDGMSGNLRVYLTDAPADFDAVWVEVSEVQVGRGEGADETWVTITDQPLTVDLLSLQNDVTAVLGDASLEPASYSQARFMVASAAAVSGGESHPLFIPSGEQTGIKFDLDFQLDAELAYAVVLDFDALASIKQTGNGLLMEPVIRVEYIAVVNEDGSLTPVVDQSDRDGDDEGDREGDDAGDEAEDDDDGDDEGDADPDDAGDEGDEDGDEAEADGDDDGETDDDTETGDGG